LGWESKKGSNIGIDYSILNGRISGSIDAYLSKSKDLLVQRALPPVSGFTSIWTNLGSIQNKGINLSVNTMNMKRNNFEWNSSIAVWVNRNKVLHLYGATAQRDASGKVIGMSEKSDTTNGWFIGHDINAVYDYKVGGVWQISEAGEAKKYNQGPGDFKIVDQSGDGKITATNDKVFQGSTSPRFSWSFRNEFKLFKQFDLAITMYANMGQLRNASYRYNNDGFANRYSFYYRPYWTPSNPINDYARMSSYNAGLGSGNYIKSSFVRISNISLAYNIPQRLVQSWGLQSLKIYANVVNAAVMSRWNWWDPENGGPTPRTYNFGVNLSL
jgi:hypothetical protein